MTKQIENITGIVVQSFPSLHRTPQYIITNTEVVWFFGEKLVFSPAF